MKHLAALLLLCLMSASGASAPAAHPPAEHGGEVSTRSQAPLSEQPTEEEAHPDVQTDHREHDVAGETEAEPHAHLPASGPIQHTHWGDLGPQTELEQTIANIGVLHSLAVHFPIALALAAALAQILFLVTGQASLAHTVRFLAWTAALGGLAAGLLGWAHAGPVATGEAGVMAWHRWIGTGLTLGLFAVAGAAEWHHRHPTALSHWTLTLLVFASAAIVSINGFLGGALAHGGLRHLLPS